MFIRSLPVIIILFLSLIWYFWIFSSQYFIYNSRFSCLRRIFYMFYWTIYLFIRFVDTYLSIRPKSSNFTKIFQKLCIVLYNPLFSILEYLQTLSKYSVKPYFHDFWTFLEILELKYFLDPSFWYILIHQIHSLSVWYLSTTIYL